jgi:hypothetical protein
MNPIGKWLQYEQVENRKKVFPVMEYIIYAVAAGLVLYSVTADPSIYPGLIFMALIPLYFGVSLTEAVMEGLERRKKLESILFISSLLCFFAVLGIIYYIS